MSKRRVLKPLTGFGPFLEKEAESLVALKEQGHEKVSHFKQREAVRVFPPIHRLTTSVIGQRSLRG